MARFFGLLKSTAERLWDAVKKGDVQEVVRILDKNPKLASDKRDHDLLFEAIRADHPGIVELLLSRGWPADATAESMACWEVVPDHPDGPCEELGIDRTNSWQPIHEARNRSQIMSVLLAAGADPNAATTDGSTPLHYAAFDGNRAIAERLLSAGADSNAQNSEGWTPLHFAAAIPEANADSTAYVQSRVNVVRVLIANGANVMAKSKSGKIPLDLSHREDHEELRSLLGGTIPERAKGPAGVVPPGMRRARGVCDDCGMADPSGMYMQRSDGRRRCSTCVGRLGGLRDDE